MFVDDWARPIFNLDTDYKHLTREERQQRDADQASLKRQTSATGKPKTRGPDMDLPFARTGYEKEIWFLCTIALLEVMMI